MQNRRVVIGVCGGIAAYKVAALVSQLRQRGTQVRVVMTEHATHFVTPITFQSLCGHRVYTSLFPAHAGEWEMMHIALADWAELMLVAPATANIIGKAAGGIADDLLSTLVLSCTCPILFAPAMNTNMYNNPAVQRNMEQLRQFGYQILAPAEGWLACGREGAGRMVEPEELLHHIQTTLDQPPHPTLSRGGERE